MKRFCLVAIFLVAACRLLTAQNPISPEGVYIADPSARVWDGRLYVYGSTDITPGNYCSESHHVLSTDDMVHWKLSRNVISSKGKGDQVPYNDAVLYAPDVQRRDGKYYMYICQPHEIAEGVAVADNPCGPFRDARPLDTFGHAQIDPAVFIDDDGQAYYVWGQFEAKIARLNPDMTSIDPASIKVGVVNEKDHFFHEGGFLAKRNGIYYLVYSHMGRLGMPTCIGYSTSTSPMGPYKYGGVIIDNSHCDPANWNNHGSIAEFDGQWYVFYHRATHNSNTMRKACAEPIFFAPDGSIPEVEMTTQGASGPLDACHKLEAERACLLFGDAFVSEWTDGKECLSHMGDGCRAVYKYLCFDSGVKRVDLLVRATGKGRLVFKQDQYWHNEVASVDVDDQSGRWSTISAPVDMPSGIHSLIICYYGEGHIDIDWLRFSKK